MAKRYEKYKDSGIAWIGEIPDSWEVKRLKFLTKFRNGFAHENDINENGEFIVVNSKFVSTDGEVKKYCDTLIQPLYKGDICIVMSDVPNGKAYAKCFIVNENFKYSLNQRVGAFHDYILKEKYFYYFINRNKELMFYDDGFNQTNLRKPDLMSISVAYPNIPEQEQIAKYLDWKCGEVDRIVEVRERQIKLLAELRTSVISRAVTRGLNPNAPLKNSGIDWIGQIPEHWEIKRVKFTGKAIIGLTYSPNDIIDKGGSIVLRSTNIQNGVLDLSDKVRVNSSISEKLKIRKGDVLLCSRNGSASLVGKCAYIGDVLDGVTWGAFTTVLRSSMKKYLYYALNSDIMKFYLGMFSTSTINQLTTGTLNNMELLIPPATEQQQIADYLDKKTAEIDSTIAKFKVQIDKLKEYRQALITEVVTGKIDVRGIEIPTPKSN